MDRLKEAFFTACMIIGGLVLLLVILLLIIVLLIYLVETSLILAGMAVITLSIFVLTFIIWIREQ